MLVAGLLLSGCWTQIGFGPEHRRQNTDERGITSGNAASLQQAWAVDVATDDEPIVSGGRVFVGYDTSTFGVQAFDVAAGTTVWNREIAHIDPAYTAQLGPVTMASGQIWVSYSARSGNGDSCGAAQVRIDPADGAADPTDREGGVLGAPPVEAGGTVAQVRTLFPSSPRCGPETAALHVTPTSGPAWSYQPAGGQLPGLPSVSGERLFVPVGNELLAFGVNGCGAATCSPAWRADLGTPVRDVVVGGGEVFALSADPAGDRAELTAVQYDGRISWRADVGASDGRLAMAGDRVYVVTAGTGERADTLQAFAGTGCGSATCTPGWSARLGGAAASTGAVIAGDITSEVVLVGRAGAVEAYRHLGCGAATCSPIATIPVDGNPRGMSVSDGHLFVTTGTQLVAFAPRQPA